MWPAYLQLAADPVHVRAVVGVLSPAQLDHVPCISQSGSHGLHYALLVSLQLLGEVAVIEHGPEGILATCEQT